MGFWSIFTSVLGGDTSASVGIVTTAVGGGRAAEGVGTADTVGAGLGIRAVLGAGGAGFTLLASCWGEKVHWDCR